MNRLFFLALLLFASPFPAVPPAQAFTIQVDTSGAPILPWLSSEITFDVNYTDCLAQGLTEDQLNGAVDTAIATWNSTPSTNLKLTRGSSVTTTVDQIFAKTTGGNPVIICDSALSTHMKNNPADPNEAPVNTSNIPAAVKILRVSGGHIALAVLMLNAEPGKAANVKLIINRTSDFFSIVFTHEMGHVLGLGHAADTNALMYYDASQKKVLGLAQDDMDGIAYLYPRNELGNAKIFGCGSLAAVSGGRPGTGGNRGNTGPLNGALAEFSMLILSCAAAVWVMKRRIKLAPFLTS